MKRILKTIAVGIATLTMAATAIAPVSAASNEVQSKRNYYVYGDVNNDGYVDAVDASQVLSASSEFSSFTGDEDLPVSYAIEKPNVYFPNISDPAPAAADVNGDGVINKADADEILEYYSFAATGQLNKYTGKCGKRFPTTKSKTYVLYNVGQNRNITYFNYNLSYQSNVIAESSEATALCNGGQFHSTHNESTRKIQNTYNGSAIGTTGALVSTKLIVPMDTDSIFDVVTYSNAVIRNQNGTTLSPASITMDEVLLGDVNLDGVVDDLDVEFIMKCITNPDRYKMTQKGKDAADVYHRGDGVTASDAFEIQRYVQGQINHF